MISVKMNVTGLMRPGPNQCQEKPKDIQSRSLKACCNLAFLSPFFADCSCR